MDESEFRRCLELFPVVRCRDYHVSFLNQMDLDSLRQSTSGSSKTEERQAAQDGGYKREAFWDKLKMAAAKKMGPTEAERFCKAFQQVYNRLVYEELSLDGARKFINSSGFSGSSYCCCVPIFSTLAYVV